MSTSLCCLDFIIRLRQGTCSFFSFLFVKQISIVQIFPQFEFVFIDQQLMFFVIHQTGF